MDELACACGCGALLPAMDSRGRPRRFVNGHGNRGKPISTEALAQRKATRIANNGGVYTSPESQQRGISKRPESWHANVVKAIRQRDPERQRQAILNRPPTWYDNVVNSIRQRDVSGANNPFYGKRHPPELQARITAQITGPLHPNWHGGIATLPYGVGFTRRFKRLIRERDGNICQRCHITAKENGRSLEVHHIDHDKSHNDPVNLITVCHSCNVYLSYHRDESLLAFPKRKMLL